MPVDNFIPFSSRLAPSAWFSSRQHIQWYKHHIKNYFNSQTNLWYQNRKRVTIGSRLCGLLCCLFNQMPLLCVQPKKRKAERLMLKGWGVSLSCEQSNCCLMQFHVQEVESVSSATSWIELSDKWFFSITTHDRLLIEGRQCRGVTEPDHHHDIQRRTPDSALPSPAKTCTHDEDYFDFFSQPESFAFLFLFRLRVLM